MPTIPLECRNDAALTTSVPGSAIGARNAGRRMPVSLVEQDGRIAVSSPYHPHFPARARSLGGTWDAAQRVWLFDAADSERVRSLCREIYGTDGPENGKDAASFPNAVAHGRNEFTEGTPPVPHYYCHRRRLRERLIAAGAETCDYELPRCCCSQPIRRAMSSRRRSRCSRVSAVWRSDERRPGALSEAGLGLAIIAAIKSVREAALRLMRSELQEAAGRRLMGQADRLLQRPGRPNKVEEFHILFLDRKNVLIKHERQQRGTIDHTPVYPREVVKRALDLGASAPDSPAQPSLGDPTRQGRHHRNPGHQAAAALGVVLHDHLIIGRNGHISLRELGEI
jgi:DNA repair protein RadC